MLPFPALLVDPIIDRALTEDLSGGDVTTDACIEPGARAVAHAVARKEMVACGTEIARRVFGRVDPSLTFDVHVADGVRVAAATRLWTVRGGARSILMAERTALNLVQRMTGIATLTRLHVDRVAEGTGTRITDTRKTTPGLRLLERYAVRTGGGCNHRDDLGSAILIKDNHVVAAGGVGAAIARARAYAAHTCKIECEVDGLAQVEEALAAGIDILLLDNMGTEAVREAVLLVRARDARVVIEASGGITLERVTELSLAGVDAISVGALTHSAPAADIGLDFEAP